MKKIVLLSWVACATLLVSCGHVAQITTPQKYSNAINQGSVKPLHIGKPRPLRHDVYHVQIYDRSVIFMSTSKIVAPLEVEIFDLNHDGSFDIVYTRGYKSWSMGVSDDFASTHPVHPFFKTLSGNEVEAWICKALEVNQKLHELEKAELKRQKPEPQTIEPHPQRWSPY